ncbi:MAG: DUF695 domain-containing protein [Aeromicrobium erythreum]
MGLFSRRTSSESDPHADLGDSGNGRPAPTPVGDFWDWWTEEGRQLDPSQAGPAHAVLDGLLASIDPDLTWHLGPGRTAQHRLTVSAGGLADARPAAERWFRAAPPADATWEYAPAVEADPTAFDAVLEVDGAAVDLARVVLAVETDLEALRVHVGVHHPAFAELPERVHGPVTFMVLDWALGEDDVARWVAGVEPLVDAPSPARTVADLQAAVAVCAEERDPDVWSALSGQTAEGRPVFALARTGARWVDAPTLDLHHALVATFEPDERGMPSPEELGRLQALDDSLTATIEPRGLVVARVTTEGTRTLHVYTDGEDQNAGADVARWASTHGLTVTDERDPGWTRVRHLLG